MTQVGLRPRESGACSSHTFRFRRYATTGQGRVRFCDRPHSNAKRDATNPHTAWPATVCRPGLGRQSFGSRMGAGPPPGSPTQERLGAYGARSLSEGGFSCPLVAQRGEFMVTRKSPAD